MRAIKVISIALILFLSVVIPSACGTSTAKNSGADSNSNQTQIIDVTTAKVIVRDMPTYFEATGTLASDAQTDVAPTIAGRIVEVNFDVGTYVNKGDVLVRLDPRDAQLRLEQARRQVVQGDAQIEQARAAVRQAEQGVEQAKRNVEQAKANVEQAKANLRQTQTRLGLSEGSNFDVNKFSQVISVRAQLDLAEKELRRAERLLATGDISRSLYDQRLAQRNQLLGQLEEARSNAGIAIRAIQTAEAGVKTAQQGVVSAQQGVNTAIAQVNSAKANVENVIRAVETSKVQISQAEKSVADTAIYAPISGYVSERVADLGEYTNPNAPNTKICTILRTSILRLKVDVPEQNVGKVAVGQGVSMKVSAYPDRNFAGTITRILPAVNVNSRTLTVEAEVESGGLLKPGMFATVRIAQSEAQPTVLVPQSAIRNDGGVTKVYVIADGRATEKLVQLGDTENDLIQVKSGLKENEQVAVSNVEQLFDGVTVRQ